MSMSKKDFVELADRIKRENATGPSFFTPYQLGILADFCQSSNPDFKRERWLGYIAGENGKNGGKK